MSERAFMDHFQHHVPFLLTSVVTSTRQCYPGVLLLKGWPLSLMYNILGWSGEEQIEWRGESASGLRLWRRPCSACHSLSNVKTAWREVRTKCDANRNCVYIHLLKEIRLESTFQWNLVRVNAFLWPLNPSRHITARIPFHKSYKLMLWQRCAHRWFKVQLPNTKAIKKKKHTNINDPRWILGLTSSAAIWTKWSSQLGPLC